VDLVISGLELKISNKIRITRDLGDTMEQAVKESHDTLKKLYSGLNKIIKGRDDTLKLVLTALAADGHVLLEDYPGSGKTTLAKSLGLLIAKDGQETNNNIAQFKRIQFTPDMLPSDVLGVTIFEPKTATFNFVRGPVFAHIILADEINRTGPKVQAAFLECMAEKQVTVDNHTYRLDDFFLVIGTQNPLDVAGTYPLPLVQLDRFLMRIPMSYVDATTETNILAGHNQIVSELASLKPVCSRSDVLHIQKTAKLIELHPAIRATIVRIVQATRSNPEFQFGVSTRAALMLQNALQAWALVNGRTYVTENDLKFMLPYVLGHRLSTQASSSESFAAIERLANPYLEELISARIY
jgi:MoxR-like ATPase